MADKHKTKAQFYDEVNALRNRISELESELETRVCREAESRWENEMARKYLDVAGVIIIALNKRGEITLINKRGCEILGEKEKEIIGKNWFENYLPRSNKGEVRSVFDKLMSGEETSVEYYQNTILTAGREERIIAWYNTVMTDNRGNPIGILSSGEDITRQKKAEEALRESEAKYKTLVQTSPDAVTVTDLKGNITYVSSRTVELHGYDRQEEMLGLNAFQLIDPSQKTKALLNIQKTLKQGLIQNEEYTFLRKDGSRFIGELNSAVIKDDAGNPKILIATTRDITDRKKTEEQLHRSIRDKEMLLQEIHHRVKNNLQIISSILDLSSMRIEDRLAQDLIEDARSKIQTMTFIHSQLYRSDSFDRIEMGGHVRELIDYLTTIYAKKKRISAYVEISDVFLPITQAIPCALILNELISNAFKHAFKNQQKGAIEVSMEITQGNQVHLKVRDDGVGMKKNIDIKKTESLGLKLVRNLVERQLKGRLKMRRQDFTEFIIDFGILDEEKTHA